MLLCAAASCSSGDSAAGSDDDTSAGGAGSDTSIEVTDGPDGASADLLGPLDEASGDPVRIGLISDGSTPALDNTSELRAGAATVGYLNDHAGGIGGDRSSS